MPSTLLTQTLPGSPGGMNVALPGQDIDDTEAQYIQDALVDFPALTRRRGPVQALPGVAVPTHKVAGIAEALDPQGTPRYGLVNGTSGAGFFSVYSDDLSALVDLPLPFGISTAPYPVVDAKTGMKGGTFIGIASDYDSGSTQMLAYWLGANRANYTTGTLTVARGSKSVVGSGSSFVGNVVPGMWLFANTDEGYTGTLVGYVQSVDSATGLTLATPSPYALTAKTFTLQSIRGIYPRVNTGRVTCATAANDLNGGDTKFLAQGLNTGSWQIYRASDWAFVGKVASVESDIHITLTGNAAISLADDAYVALRADANWSMDLASDKAKAGWMSASYAGRQWFLNRSDTHEDTYRVVYTDVDDPEEYDLSLDGTTDFVGSQSVVQESARGIAAAYNALLIMKENETYSLTGSSPSQFSISKIEDDGVLSGMSIQPYGGGVIWAGREGIHFYDGVQVNNLVADKFGDVWKNSVRSFDPTLYRMYSMMVRNHYWLFIENIAPTIGPIKGGVSDSRSHWVVVVNMTTQAVTMATNVGIRGSIILPASAGSKVWYVVNDSSHGYVATADDLFDAEGLDQLLTAGTVLGPDFYYESKKFDAGDSLRLKKFKLLALHYLAQGGALMVDTVLGLNEFGQTIQSKFPASVFTWDTLRASFSTWDILKTQFTSWADVIDSVFVPKRVKFQRQSQFLSFRLYQENLSMTRVKIGPFQIGYKIMRAGRV